MAKIALKSVDEYIGLQPENLWGLLERVRGAIRKASPGAEEMISYGVPTYKLRGRPLIYFAAWKRHYSLYPASAGLVEELGDELAAYEVEKGTIRFPYSAVVPVRLIGRIAKFRAKEVVEREMAQAGGPKKRRPAIDLGR